jgi:hypothetical protein
MKESYDNRNETLSRVTNSGHLSYDRETATRFYKTSVVLSGRTHNFSAEYELGFRDRNDGKSAIANPYRNKLARDRWQRGWNARDRYTDAGYKWVEPITDSKIVVWIIAVVFFGGWILVGILQGANP